MALTLGALLQWVAPIAAKVGLESDLTEIFAEALQSQLLPKEVILNIRDFLVFAEMGMECRELPAEDVEECVRHIKRTLPGIDMSDPADRERLFGDVQRFFADPARKYKTAIQALETRLASTAEDLTLAQAAAATTKEEQDHLSVELAKLSTESDAERSQFERDRTRMSSQISSLEGRLDSADRLATLRRSRRVAWSIFSCSLVVLAALVVGLLVVSSNVGEGKNPFQRLVNSWGIYLAIFAAWILGVRAAIGRDRARTMKFVGALLFPERDGKD